MLFIPAGTFEYTGPVPGSADKSPKQQVFHLQAFCIDQFEVPNLRHFEGKAVNYGAVEETCGARSSLCMTYINRSGPATCVTVQQAECFCAHILPGQPKRLPTDAEWLYAALGTDGRPFPWGQEEFPPGVSGSRDDFCSFSNGIHEDPGDSLCYPVGNTRDRGPFGVIGMATNGSELVQATPDGTGETKWLRRGPLPGDDDTTLVEQIHDYGPNPSPDGLSGFRCVLSKRARP
jgi:formylglycine-generating enzyme required for sulfatase activity